MQELYNSIVKFIDNINDTNDLFFFSMEKNLSNATFDYIKSNSSFSEKEEFIHNVFEKVIYFYTKELNESQSDTYSISSNGRIRIKKIFSTWFEKVICLDTKSFWYSYFKRNPDKLIKYSMVFPVGILKIHMFDTEEMQNILKELPDDSLDSLVSKEVMTSFSTTIAKKNNALLLIKKAKKEAIIEMLDLVSKLNEIKVTKENDFRNESSIYNYQKKMESINFLKNIYSANQGFGLCFKSHPIKIIKQEDSYRLYFDIKYLDNISSLEIEEISISLMKKVNVKIFATNFKLNKMAQKIIPSAYVNEENLPYYWLIGNEVAFEDLDPLFEKLKNKKRKFDKEYKWNLMKKKMMNSVYSLVSKELPKPFEPTSLLKSSDLDLIDYVTGVNSEMEKSHIIDFDFVRFSNECNDLNFVIYLELKDFIKENPELLTPDGRYLTEEGIDIFRLNFQY